MKLSRNRFAVMACALTIGLLNTALVQAKQTSDTEEIVKVLEVLQDSESIAFKGRVKQPNNQPQGGPGGATVVVTVGNDASKNIFEDDFEVVANLENEELAIVSKDSVPGLAIYDDGEVSLNQVTYEDEMFSIENLSSDLRQILDVENLIKYVGRATKVKKEAGKDGESIYKCKLSPRMIRNKATANPLAVIGATAKIEAINATITIANDKLMGLEISVERANPLRDLMKRGNVQIEGAGAFPGNAEQMIKNQIQNKVLVYELQSVEKPSKRTESVISNLQDMASGT